MRHIRSAWLTVAGLISIQICAITAHSADDHLTPTYRLEFPRYYELLDKVIGQTEFDCGRVMVTPAFDPEYSISVYGKKGSHPSVFAVAYVLAERNVWRATNMGQHPEHGPTARRLDADLPEETAELLRRVWVGMLTGKQAPRSKPEDRYIISDPTSAEFSITLRGEKTASGEIENVSVKPRGRKVRELMLLAWLLRDYAKAPATERPRLVRQLDEKARLLLTLLENGKGEKERMHR